MYKKMIQTAVVVCALAIQPIALACGGEGLKNMVDSLSLDSNQKAKIKPILEQLRSTMKNDASQMLSIRQQLSQQVESSNMEQSTVDGLVDQKTKLIGDMMKAKITAKHQIYMLLTPQQKTDFQNKMKQVEKKWADKFSHCHDE